MAKSASRLTSIAIIVYDTVFYTVGGSKLKKKVVGIRGPRYANISLTD
jgi:hypothetical protein